MGYGPWLLITLVCPTTDALILIGEEEINQSPGSSGELRFPGLRSCAGRWVCHPRPACRPAILRRPGSRENGRCCRRRPFVAATAGRRGQRVVEHPRKGVCCGQPPDPGPRRGEQPRCGPSARWVG